MLSAETVSAPIGKADAPNHMHEESISFKVLNLTGEGRTDPSLLEKASINDFFSAYWLPLLKKSYGFEAYMLLCKRGDRVEAALPIVEIDSIFTKKRAVAIPFFDFYIPSRCKPDATETMLTGLKEMGKQKNWKYIELRGSLKHPLLKPSLTYLRHSLEINRSSDDLFKDLKSATQRAIRKAIKSGVVVKESTDIKAMEEFYHLQCQTRKRHGLPPQPWSFFKNMQELILSKDLGKIFIAYVGREPVAANLIIHQNEEVVHYKYGASDLRYQKFRGSNLVMWRVIEHYSKRGYKLLEFGRNSTSQQSGLRQYKLSWGATESTCNYYRFDVHTGQTLITKDQAFGIHNKLFTKLPIFANRAIGSLLYRHIA